MVVSLAKEGPPQVQVILTLIHQKKPSVAEETLILQSIKRAFAPTQSPHAWSDSPLSIYGAHQFANTRATAATGGGRSRI